MNKIFSAGLDNNEKFEDIGGAVRSSKENSDSMISTTLEDKTVLNGDTVAALRRTCAILCPSWPAPSAPTFTVDSDDQFTITLVVSHLVVGVGDSAKTMTCAYTRE